MYNIKAIPTIYNGVQYRSRLEAKWAIFFDLLNWKYSYEPDDLHKWSPDFKLVTSAGTKFLVEIKPTVLTDRKLRLKLGEATNFSSNILILGEFPFQADFNNFIGISSIQGKTKNHLNELDFEFCSSVIMNLYDQGNDIFNLCIENQEVMGNFDLAEDFTSSLWKEATNKVQFLKP
jgi:hypothetical protein